MKKKLVILGAGPRGLAVALRATTRKDLDIYVVDKHPLQTWSIPNMLPNIKMRSPISFDLVTFQKDLQQYSLHYFLKGTINLLHTQKDVELNNEFCSRVEFVDYLTHTIKVLKQKGVTFVKHNYKLIQKEYVQLCCNIQLPYDYLVVATGSETNEPNIPSFIRNKKIYNIQDVLNNSWSYERCNVIGSGQQAAEVVLHLIKERASVVWLQNQEPKINQYPVPSYKLWGMGSALSGYFRNVTNKDEYLSKVKQWAPSITPEIHNQLKLYKTFTTIPLSTKDVDMDRKFVVTAGNKNSFKSINWDFDIQEDRVHPRYPLITKNFASESNSNIFFTGLLALHYDGPRQGSIISSGITASEIINSIPS